MTTKQETPMVFVALFTGIMLLMVFVGESLPEVVRTIIYALCLTGTIGVLVVKNILSEEGSSKFRRLFSIGFLIFAVILVFIILLDHWFVVGDSLHLGMEPATSLLVSGVTFFPFSFIFLWIIGFDRVVAPPEKRRRLEELSNQSREESIDG